MRPGKPDLHFLVGVELLPHAFVNIPDEKMHIGVFLLFFIIFFIFHIFMYLKFSSHLFPTVTIINISHLSSLPSIPNVKCIAWNFDGSNFVSKKDKKDDLKRLKFENGDTIPHVESYFN
jgi:hypothetical protein